MQEYISTFLASVKPSNESLTMDDFLSAVQLDLDSYILAMHADSSAVSYMIWCVCAAGILQDCQVLDPANCADV